MKTTSNQYSLGNIDNPEKARQSQYIQANTESETHIFSTNMQ